MRAISTDEASPSCVLYGFQTAVDDGKPYTSFLCLPKATNIIVFVDANSGGGSGSSAVETSDVSGGSSPTETSGPSTSNSDSNNSGNSSPTEDQKIALGVGIGVGVPAVIVAFLAWWWPRQGRW
ncbi:hypothetical protein O1611_g1368 [Lasiodiplodia mahajangana]|uniref:Uncharacterized protein n=1 Tax=Lasiodiplodia mahajangana TaxID=1108764 RepID=A0ACC2JXV7_9PEZI|nr:hypothetical protein O1611_g1368 [Lasiodiplodia mahajangana]